MPQVASSGARIAYTRTGVGPAALLLQGVGVAGSAWRPQIEALCGRFSLIAPDNRGVGGSSAGDGPLSIEQMAADALAVAAAEGVARFHLAGHSMGGLIAQSIALSAPERVASLALLCTFACGVQGSRPSASLLLPALRSRIGPRGLRRSAFLELIVPREQLRGGGRAALAERLAALFGHDLAEPPPASARQLRAMRGFDARARLRELAAIPTLVLSASLDRIARPAFGRELAASIPGSRYVEVADAGHAVPIQNAAEVNHWLREHWLAGGGSQ